MSTSLVRRAARLLCACVGVATVSLAATPSAEADLIHIDSDLDNRLTNKAEFKGKIEYTYDPVADVGTLLITIRNKNPQERGGYVTGVIFNINSQDPDATATLVDAPNRFEQAIKRNGGPFGWPYDAGVALEGRFMGGGKPRFGLASGQKSTFEFLVSASDAASLGAADFIKGPFDYDFLVRFRGHKGGGGDVVPGQIIPAPSTLALLGIASMALARRRKSAA